MLIQHSSNQITELYLRHYSPCIFQMSVNTLAKTFTSLWSYPRDPQVRSKTRTTTMCQKLSILHIPLKKECCCHVDAKYTIQCPILLPTLSGSLWHHHFLKTEAKMKLDVQVLTEEMPVRENGESGEARRAIPPWQRTDLCRSRVRDASRKSLRFSLLWF